MAHPNDAMFKYYLTQPVHAASLIRAVFPQDLVDRLDLDHLELVPGSFVDEDLTDRHCDVLMRTRFAGREAFVFTIIEHQSRPDRMMPLRMVEYMVKVWRRYRRDHPNSKRLPLILPLVVYEGERKWAYSTQLSDLIDVDPELAEPAERFMPRFAFVLDDETKVDLTELRGRPFTRPVRLTLRLLKVVPAHREDVPAALDEQDIEDFRGLREYADWREGLAALFAYIQLVGETPLDKLVALAARIGPEAKEVVVTTAEQLRAEGKTEGRAEGLAEGEGRVLVRLLTRKFGAVPGAVRQRIDTASLEQLETWCDRVLEATTLDEVFG